MMMRRRRRKRVIDGDLKTNPKMQTPAIELHSAGQTSLCKSEN